MLVKMDARGIISAIFRQSRKFLLVFVPINVLALLYILTATPAYQSTASLLVKFGQDARPEVTIEGGPSSGLSAEEKRGLVQSNVNILSSRDLAQALLTDITVAKAYPSLADAGDDKAMELAVKQLSTDLVTNTQSDAGIINVGMFNQDPKVATEMLSHLLDLFTQRQAEIFGNPQTEVLSAQAGDAYKRLEEANRALSEFKVQNGITDLDQELSLLLKQRGDLTGYLSRRHNTMSAAPEAVETGEGGEAIVDPASVPTAPSVGALPVRIAAQGDSGRFPVLEDIQQRLDTMRAKEAELLLTYRANSVQVRNLRNNIAAEEAAMDSTLGALGAQIADLDKQIAEKQAHRVAYENLARQVQVNESAYKISQSRLEAAQVNSDLNQRKITRISVIQQPLEPYKPSRPQKLLTLLLSVIVGGAIAMSVCLLSELLDQTFSSTEQVRAVLDRPVLAGFARQAGNSKLGRQDLAGLYHSIEMGLADQPGRAVYLASCYSGEGTSTLAYELGQYAADTLKRRVLLVEQRNSGLVQMPSSSLLSVGEGKSQLGSALAPSGSIHIAHLVGDQQPDVALANLSKLQPVLLQLRPSFDLILIPAAGLIQNTSILGLSKLADGVVVIIEAERTRAPVVAQALQQLAEAGNKIIGTVLNKRNYYIPKWLYGRL